MTSSKKPRRRPKSPPLITIAVPAVTKEEAAGSAAYADGVFDSFKMPTEIRDGLFAAMCAVFVYGRMVQQEKQP